MSENISNDTNIEELPDISNPNTDSDFLSEPILVYRKMSSDELFKFVSGESIKPVPNHEWDKELTTAGENSIFFSPEKLQYIEDDNTNLEGLAEGRVIDDFEERDNIWASWVNYAKSVIVEFKTKKNPRIETGKYNNKRIKEYVYDIFSIEDFQVQRIYSEEQKKIIFQSSDYENIQERNLALRDLATNLRGEEKDALRKQLDLERKIIELQKEGKFPKP